LRTPAVASTVEFDVETSPSNVASTGLSEILGEVYLSAMSSCGNAEDAFCISEAESIRVRFTNVEIDNAVGTGIQVCESVGNFACNEAGTFLTGEFTIAADTLIIGVRQGVNLAAFDRLTVVGVRGRIATGLLITPGTESLAVVSAVPTSAASFPPDTLVASRSASPLLMQVTGVPEIPCADGDAVPTVLVTEGYGSVFVDYGDPVERTRPGPPLLPRNPLGGNANTRISLTLAGLNSDVQIHWPVTVEAQNSTAVLDLISQSEDGSTATYVYGTPDQLGSDEVSEIFAMRLGARNFRFTGDAPLSGIVSVQGRLLPAATPANVRPRFDHPLGPDPGLGYFLLKRCPSAGAGVGSASVRATIDGQPWTGSLYYHLEGPSYRNGTLSPQTVPALPPGTYVASLLSGGPAGAQLAEIAPSNTRLIAVNGSVEFVFSFAGPTTAILELSAAPLAVCPDESATVGTYQLSNDTGDTQIIPAGAALEFTFSAPLLSLPEASGIENATISSSISSVKYEFPDGLTLPAGSVMTFSESSLDLSGVPGGQAVTVLLTGLPAQALQLSVNQATVATADLSTCPPPPAFVPAGLTNGASFEVGITAGSIATLFGVNLIEAVGIHMAGSVPLPTEIEGTSMTVNGMAAPLLAVANVGGQEQINFQVPWEVAGAQVVTVIVNNNERISPPLEVGLQPVRPGIFTRDGIEGAILHGIGSEAVTPSNPALPGEVVTIFATGLGPVSSTPATGTAAPVEPQSITAFPPTVMVAGMQATVEFSGLAPGFVGLYQINVKLPAGLPSGIQELVLEAAGRASKPVTIAIQ
jgi:uncharacterized protein (TIGR03437 family)